MKTIQLTDEQYQYLIKGKKWEEFIKINAHLNVIDHLAKIINYNQAYDDRKTTISSNDKDMLISLIFQASTLNNSDKLSRWVGFIQGVLYSNGLLDLQEERNYAQKIYAPVYKELGLL